MWIFGTYRFVPPISLEAWARAVVVFGAYLAVREYGVPQETDPFAFALALEFGLLVIHNLLRAGPNLIKGGLIFNFVVWAPILALAGLTMALLPKMSAVGALYFYVAWTGLLALVYFGLSKWDDREEMGRNRWYRGDPEAARAMQLDAGAYALVGLTVLALKPFDPLFQIAFITFGTKIMWFFANWTILLMLYQKHRDRDGM